MSEREPSQNRSDFTPPTAEFTLTISPRTNMRSPVHSNVSSSATSPGVVSPPMQPTNTQRQPSNALRLAPVPKYHPAVYRSPANSHANTPGSSRPTSRGLLSPRGHTRQFSEVQRQHQEYQRQMLATLRQTAGFGGSTPTERPSAPHLLPHDSPGPTTPLNLEEGGDYLSARNIGEGSPRELAARLVREEQERRQGMRVDRTSPAISPRC